MFANQYSKFYDLFNSFKPYKKEINFIYEWAGFPLKILDIGCGTADYWKYYPQWVQLVGLEKSKYMIAESRYKSLIIRGDIHQPLWKKKNIARFDCVTALFDVINYMPKHDWWKNLPLKKGGYFIFDIWDKNKVDRDGFKKTVRRFDKIARRTITPFGYDGKKVDLKICVYDFEDVQYTENHRMYVYSHEDILKFCGKDFEVVEVKRTKKWQVWYKCVKR